LSRAESKPPEPSIRPAVSSDIPGLLALEHNYSTDHVWQMGYHPLGEEVNIAFREVRLPRPMRVIYPRSQESLADEWTQAAILLVAPLGFVMGMPFPSGLRRVGQGPFPAPPFYWGLNGVLSVVGSVVTVLLAVTWGFRLAALLGAACYLLAAASSSALERRAASE